LKFRRRRAEIRPIPFPAGPRGSPTWVADVGGDIHASLADKTDIAPIERRLAAFMSAI